MRAPQRPNKNQTALHKSAAYFLDRLRLHLRDKGEGERELLLKLFRDRLGKKIKNTMLSRWLNLRSCPSFDTGLVLLSFAKRRGLILETASAAQLFNYAPAASEVSALKPRHLKKTRAYLPHLKAYVRAGKRRTNQRRAHSKKGKR